jgi:D-alanine-D-alanine ligase
LAILKAKSPSCGKGLIHNGLFDGGLVPGDGMTAQLLMENGITVMTEQEWLDAQAVS